MKTVLITVFSPFAARHVLGQDFLRLLRAGSRLKLIYVVPQHKKSFYDGQLRAYPDVAVEGVSEWRHPTSWLDGLFFSLSLHYLETETVKILRRSWGKDRGIRFFLLSWPLFKLFKLFPLCRRFGRWLDAKLVVDRRPQLYLDLYKPDLVVATHAIYFQEQAFIREAKRRGIKTLSIVNSWDNLTVYKGTLRVLPDWLVVPNEIVKEEAIKLCDMVPARVLVIGMWGCDHYFKNQPSSWEDFCRRLGADTTKRLILFASTNNADTEWQDVAMIQEAITIGDLPPDLQILIRSHPDPTAPFYGGALADFSNIIFQNASTVLPEPTPGSLSYEITPADDQNAHDAIYHSTVVVVTQSTISIEAAVLDRPVININFDGWEERPFYHPRGVKHYHQFTHYLAVHRSGGVRLANNRAELIEWLNFYLSNPAKDKERRREMAQQFCWRLDGGAVSRLAKLILQKA